MSLSSTSIPKPKNWQDFESNTRVLMAGVLDDPNTQQHGRQGQPQCGVDVYGYRDRDTARLVGVQCKQKLYDAVTEIELRAEVKKAKKFKPNLSEFILATTAPRDQAIQEVARTITKELATTKRPFTVSVWGWEDVEHYASQHPAAYKAFDPTWNSFAEQGFARIEQQLKQVTELVNRTQAPSVQPTAVADDGSQNTPLHGKITAYVALIDEGHVQTAVAHLEKLKETEWKDASPSERYRLTVAFAAAKLKNSEYEAAGQLLLAAFYECPGHKRAKENLAKGYLLLDEYDKAKHAAREALAEDPENADAASTLIQTRLHDPECTSALDDVPPGLLEAEDVLLARIHFLRCKDDLEWLPLAKEAAKKHPASRLLRVMAAEAILDALTRSDRDVIAGAPVKIVSQEELRESVKVLREEAESAIGRGYRISPALASNAALALRFVDDIAAATRILESALKQHPDDESLRLQRATLAFADNDMTKVLELTDESLSDLEATPLRAIALADTGRQDDALRLIEGFDGSAAPEHVKVGVISARCHAYLVRGDKELAIETARKESLAAPANLHVAAVLIRTYYLAGDNEAASKALDEAIARVSGTTKLSSCLLLSFEAQRLDRNDAIVQLLKDRVATDHESEALRLLIAAAINGGFWVTAQETLDAIRPPFRAEEWVQKAETILALNTGHPDAEQKVGAYLKQWPNDTPMIHARLGAWQRSGRDKDIKNLLAAMDFEALKGSPSSRIRIAAVACHYGVGARALDYAYAVLMDNWNDAKAHLTYQGLILLGQQIGSILPREDVVGENTVVVLANEGGERRYRIEKRAYAFFKDERLEPGDDLSVLLLGKKAGDTFVLQQRIGATPVTVKSVKPVQVDAFHRSLDQFNERFPRAGRMMKFKFDVTAEDPLEEMRVITKERAEADQSILKQYRSTGVPLAFLAAAIGRDPIEAWAGLAGVNVPFRVCRGIADERDEALTLLAKRERGGCVVDAITLSVIRRLGVADAVVAVCGPLNMPQGVLDLLAERAFRAEMDVGKNMGFVSWRDGQLVMQECSNEMLKSAAEENEAERAWAVANVATVTTMPKQEFSSETRTIVETFGHAACDPAVAADGSGLLLLSEDMGLRLWGVAAFNVHTTWLQPVLMIARYEGKLSEERYFEAINTLALSGHSYVSLEAGALIHQARKEDFELTGELERLLNAVGGPTADLRTNCGVAAEFLGLVLEECPDDSKVLRIGTQVFASMVKGRAYNDQRPIVAAITNQLTDDRKGWFLDHALAWLVGHSIGMPDFDELLAIQKRRMERQRR